MGEGRRLLVERRELLQDLVPLHHGVVEALLGRFVAAEDVLHLLLDGVADGIEVPEPDPLAVGRRLAAVHLADGRLLVRVLRVVAGGLQGLGRAVRERQISRHPRPPRLVLGGGEILEELRDALVLPRLGALHHPERGRTDDRVPLRETRETGQKARAPRELAFRGAGEVADVGRRGREDPALAGGHERLALVDSSAVREPAFLGAAREQLHHLHAEWAVDLERGREAVEAVAVIGEGLVVVGVHVLDQHPRRPRRAERTLDPRGLELLRHRLDLVPRRRRLVRETRSSSTPVMACQNWISVAATVVDGNPATSTAAATRTLNAERVMRTSIMVCWSAAGSVPHYSIGVRRPGDAGATRRLRPELVRARDVRLGRVELGVEPPGSASGRPTDWARSCPWQRLVPMPVRRSSTSWSDTAISSCTARWSSATTSGFDGHNRSVPPTTFPARSTTRVQPRPYVVTSVSSVSRSNPVAAASPETSSHACASVRTTSSSLPSSATRSLRLGPRRPRVRMT